MINMRKTIFLSLCLLTCVFSFKTSAQVAKGPEKTEYRRTAGGKRYAALIDIMHQAQRFHSLDSVRKEIRIIKELGFERVYFVLCNPGYPSHSSPFNALMPMGKEIPYRILETVLELGDPNWVYLNEAKKAGLEAFAIIKPYESGSGATIPEGKTAPYSRAMVKTIGGSHIHFDNLLSAHPEYRVQRKPLADSVKRRINEPVTAFEISFCIDSFTNKTGLNQFLQFKGYPRSEVPVPDVELWVSKDNGTYSKFPGSLRSTSSFVRKPVYDANRRKLYDNKEHLVLKLEHPGIGEEYKYFVVLVRSGKTLYTLPYSMIRVFTKSGEMPVTIGVHARSPITLPGVNLTQENKIWGMEVNPVKGENAIRNFKDWGVEFEWHGTGFWGHGWEGGGFYAIAKGVRSEMKGTPCEAYPEVREYWMQQVRRAVDMGFDGVDFRLQNHSAMVPDHLNYGYNEPIVKRYRELYHVDILKEEADPYKIMKIRGDYYHEFLEEAAKYIHAHNKVLKIHLRDADQNSEESYVSSDFNELGFWTMPKIVIDWKKAVDLADEITLKHYYHNSYREELADRIKAYARSKNKPVWAICNVDHREFNETFFSAMDQDPLVEGVVFYEFANGVMDTYGKADTSKPYSLTILQKLFKQFGYTR